MARPQKTGKRYPRYFNIFLLSLLVFSSLTVHGNIRSFSDYEIELKSNFLTRLPSGLAYYPEWDFRKLRQKRKIVDCLEKSFNYFITLQESAEISSNDKIDEFKTYQGQCEDVTPKLNFLIKEKNIKEDYFEITFFQDDLLGKGGFKEIFSGVNIIFKTDKSVDYQHSIVGRFIKEDKYSYYKEKEINRFRRLGPSPKLVEQYGFFDTDENSHYLSQRRYLSWKDFKDKILPKLNKDQKKKIIFDVVEGAKFIHSKNHIHGDIKESNLFFRYSASQKRYVALIGDLDGLGPLGSSGFIYTKQYLSNYNFLKFITGQGLVMKKEDDLFAVSMVAEAIMKGFSSVYQIRTKDIKRTGIRRYVNVKKHNKKCQKVSYKEIGSYEISRLINRLRCEAKY